VPNPPTICPPSHADSDRPKTTPVTTLSMSATSSLPWSRPTRENSSMAPCDLGQPSAKTTSINWKNLNYFPTRKIAAFMSRESGVRTAAMKSAKRKLSKGRRKERNRGWRDSRRKGWRELIDRNPNRITSTNQPRKLRRDSTKNARNCHNN
jgi:hypothetical protein